MTEWK